MRAAVLLLAFVATAVAAPVHAQPNPQARDDAFLTVQIEVNNGAAEAMARVGARAAARTTALSAATRDQEAAARRHEQLREELGLIASQGGQASTTQREQLRAAEESLRTQDLALRRDFPEYLELIEPQPLSRADAQALLAADEALIVFSRPGQSSTFAWAITRESAQWTRIAINETLFTERILELRQYLDPTAGCFSNDAGSGAGALDYDTDLAADLYRDMFAPLEPTIAGKRRLIIVPHGALMSLPFAALIMSPVSGDPRETNVLRSARWLGIERALTILPSVSSLRALRCPRRADNGACVQRVRAQRTERSFVGIGAPRLNGGGAANEACVRSAPMRGELAAEASLARLAPLRGAQQELENMRTLFGVQRSTLLTGADATEAAVRSADLERASIISFATHGLLAQEARALAGVSESGLVLTPPMLQAPPRAPTREDDGLLTATEAAALRLDADWIILSACNTAQGGHVGDAALSGLSRAFFFAGARALLVSQWPVDDAGAAELVVDTLRRARNSSDRAEALRAAMQAMLQNPNEPRFAHPSVWAPFVLVGESRS